MRSDPAGDVSESPAAAWPPLEYPACPLCRSERREFVTRLPQDYNIAQCQQCGVQYLYPRLTEPAMHQVYREPSYYEGGDSGYSDTSYIDQEASLRATFRKLLRNLDRRGLTGGDLLEVGCGYGYFLEEAKPYFRRRVGTEFSEGGAARARASGADVFVGGIDQLPDNVSFDCAVAVQVIEHIYDPVAFISELVKWIKPGGYVVLATPDIAGALRKLMGRRWPSFKVPEHVVYFDFDSLKRLLAGAGLCQVGRLPYPHAFPLGLLAAKFGLSLPQPLARLNAWVPATTVAAYGRVSQS
ncbi:MAG TPA: class I SAM-dependent methyltransferase [Chthoniobacterales bacterium]